MCDCVPGCLQIIRFDVWGEIAAQQKLSAAKWHYLLYTGLECSLNINFPPNSATGINKFHLRSSAPHQPRQEQTHITTPVLGLKARFINKRFNLDFLKLESHNTLIFCILSLFWIGGRGLDDNDHFMRAPSLRRCCVVGKILKLQSCNALLWMNCEKISFYYGKI